MRDVPQFSLLPPQMNALANAGPCRILTIGHSTRSWEEFLALLRTHRVQLLIDVRRYPGSRRFPHFSQEVLAAALAEAGIDYRHEVALGGRRRADQDSPNTHWRNEQFRAYADYQATEEFQSALRRLIEDAQRCLPVILCAEAVPWRCHRQLIADALVARGCQVAHILSHKRAEPHTLNSAATLVGDGILVYSTQPKPSQQRLFD